MPVRITSSVETASTAVLDQLEALRVGVDELQLGLGSLLLQRLLVRRSQGRADVLARQVVDARRCPSPPGRGSGRCAMKYGYEKSISRSRSALIVIVERTMSTVPSLRNGIRLSEIASMNFGLTPRASAIGLAHVDVEALDVAGLRVLEAERRDVELHADRDLARSPAIRPIVVVGRALLRRSAGRPACRVSSSSPHAAMASAASAMSATTRNHLQHAWSCRFPPQWWMILSTNSRARSLFAALKNCVRRAPPRRSAPRR